MKTFWARRRTACTSVMRMMNVLERKGHLKKTQVARAYVYEPAAPKKSVLGAMVAEFVGRVFNGSAVPLMQHLVEEEKLTVEEMEEIQRLLRQRRTKR
jgi:predicted transcriptional regulator